MRRLLHQYLYSYAICFYNKHTSSKKAIQTNPCSWYNAACFSRYSVWKTSARDNSSLLVRVSTSLRRFDNIATKHIFSLLQFDSTNQIISAFVLLAFRCISISRKLNFCYQNISETIPTGSRCRYYLCLRPINVQRF